MLVAAACFALLFSSRGPARLADAGLSAEPRDEIPDAPMPRLEGAIVYVTASQLKVRDRPDLKAQTIGLLNKGDNLRILGRAGDRITVEGITSDWVRFDYRGKTGYAFGGFVSAKRPALKYSPAELAQIQEMNRAYQEELIRQEREAMEAAQARGEMYQNCDPCTHYKVDVDYEEARAGCTVEKKAAIKKIEKARNVRLYEAARIYGDEYCIILSERSSESGSQCAYNARSFYSR